VARVVLRYASRSLVPARFLSTELIQAPSTSTFKSRALPLHANITHTPPSIPDEKTENAAPADPGFLGGVTLIATDFATGSYGWKGAKRFTVELDDPENPDGPKEKVHVMLKCVLVARL
jgi:hypothetical protein